MEGASTGAAATRSGRCGCYSGCIIRAMRVRIVTRLSDLLPKGSVAPIIVPASVPELEWARGGPDRPPSGSPTRRVRGESRCVATQRSDHGVSRSFTCKSVFRKGRSGVRRTPFATPDRG
jgi:hypothetical protein